MVESIIVYAAIAQLVERIHGKDEVSGSSPDRGSILIFRLFILNMDKQSSAAYMRHIRDLTAGYPRFEDGRVNYTDERVCFVLNCVVVSGDQVLLTKRSSEVIAYPELVNGISGFIDNPNLSIEDIAYGELAEEIGISRQHIIHMKLSRPFVQIDQQLDREWHVVAVLVELASTITPRLNWENKSAAWFKLKAVPKMKLMPGFAETVRAALAMRRL